MWKGFYLSVMWQGLYTNARYVERVLRECVRNVERVLLELRVIVRFYTKARNVGEGFDRMSEKCGKGFTQMQGMWRGFYSNLWIVW